jgi:FkbM family methyltransferase
VHNPNRPLPFVIAATEQGTLIVNHLDYKPANHEGGIIGVGSQLLRTASFDASEISNAVGLIALQRNIRGDGVVALDCGANIGVHTVSWARSMTGWGSILAFEAQQRIFYALAGNICIQNCFNAEAYHVALGAYDGSIDIPNLDYSQPASFGSLEIRKKANTEDIGQPIEYEGARLQPVKMIRIDSLNLPRVDFMKIDVEGMENDVISGSLATISRSKPIMLIEWIKSDVDLMKKTLRDLGYNFHKIGGNLLAIPKNDPAENQIRVS